MKRKKLFDMTPALENDDMVDDVTVSEDVPMTPEEVVADPDSVEAELMGDEANDDEDFITASTEGLEAVEYLITTLEKYQETGISAESAELLGQASKYTFESLGFETDQLMPSLEDFGGTNTRAVSTAVTVEGWKEKVAEGFEQLKAFIKRVLKAIRESFNALFDGTKKLKSNIKKVETQLNKAKEMSIGNADFENKTISRIFMVSSGKVTTGVVLEQLNRHKAVAELPLGVAGDLGKFMESLDKAADAADTAKDAESAGKAAEETDKAADDFVKVAKDMTSKIKGATNAGNGVQIGKLTRNRAARFYFSKSAGVDTNDFVKVEVVSEGKMKATSVCKTASVKELEDVLKVCQELADGADKTKNEIGKNLKSFESKALKVVDKAIKTAKKDSNTDQATALRKNRRAVTGAVNAYSALFKRIPALSVAAGNGGLAFIAGNLAQYKKKEVAK